MTKFFNKSELDAYHFKEKWIKVVKDLYTKFRYEISTTNDKKLIEDYKIHLKADCYVLHYWVTKEGIVHKIVEMEDSHLDNCTHYFKNKTMAGQYIFMPIFREEYKRRLIASTECGALLYGD